MDPLGADVTMNPYLFYQSPSYLNLKENGERLFDEGDDPFSVGSGCSLDGMPVSCSYLNRRMDDGSVQTQYVGLYERDPSLAAGAASRFVPVTRNIRNHGLGIYEVWMPPEFRNEYSRGGWVLVAPQRSACATFVDDTLIYHSRLNQKSGKLNVGRGFLTMIPRNQSERERYYTNLSVSGFQDRLVRHQGGWVYAHITGIAGGTLIGDSPIGLWGQTGNELVAQQIGDDRRELNEVLARQQRGDTTYDYYGTMRPIQDVLDERRAEIADDDAGHDVGSILGEAIDRKISFEDARSRIFDLLCDH
jgi:hypothetical protein